MKEFDLKVGDTVLFNSGETGKVLEVYESSKRPSTNHIYCISHPGDGVYYYRKDGTVGGLPRSYFIKSKLVPHGEAWKDQALEWIVGNYYKNRGGEKVKLLADWIDEEELIDKDEVLQWVGENSERYGTYADGIYNYDKSESEYDIIDYWEKPKPKLHKKLEKKIMFNDNEPDKRYALDALTELNTTNRCFNMDYEFEDVGSYRRTATVKTEIVATHDIEIIEASLTNTQLDMLNAGHPILIEWYDKVIDISMHRVIRLMPPKKKED